jgi:ComF family protein
LSTVQRATLPSRALPWAKSVLRVATDLIYPPQCAGCGQATADPHAFCASCWTSFRFLTRPFCERYGTPFQTDLGGVILSPRAIADPPVFERARSAVLYDGIAAELVKRLKFGDDMQLVRPISKLMLQAGAELLADCDCLVPVPVHRWRLFQRQFNQAAELAKPLSKASGKPLLLDVLNKVKRTPPQASLPRDQRKENLQGAFRVAQRRSSMIEGKRILLIDDVITTASTANACARNLLRAGAGSVDVLAFAVVVPEA